MKHYSNPRTFLTFLLLVVFGTLPAHAGTFTYSDGERHLFNPDTTTPGLNVGGLAGNPSSLTDGDVWYNSSTGKLMARENGATVELRATPSLTASRLVVTNGSGTLAASAATATEAGYLSGVSSALQTQINAKAALASPTFTGTVGGANGSFSGDFSIAGETTLHTAVVDTSLSVSGISQADEFRLGVGNNKWEDTGTLTLSNGTDQGFYNPNGLLLVDGDATLELSPTSAGFTDSSGMNVTSLDFSAASGPTTLTAPVAGGAILTSGGNLSGLANAATARTNLQLTIGTDVLAPAGDGGSLTVSGRTLSTEMGYALTELPLLLSSTNWSAATVSGSGTVNVNNQNYGLVMSVQTSSNSIFVRQYLGLGSSYNYLPGTEAAVDFTKAWRLKIRGGFKLGGSGAKWTLLIGTLGSAPSAHTLSAKGWRLTMDGTGASTGTVSIGLHNGTTATNSSTATGVLTGTTENLELTWIPGTGLYLTRKGTALCNVTTNLPTGTGTSGNNGWAILLEHPSSSFSSVVNVHAMTLATP